MTPLQQELSSLEVEPLQTVEKAPESEQESSLEALTTLGDVEVAAILKSKGVFAAGSTGPCCCCCCPICCC